MVIAVALGCVAGVIILVAISVGVRRGIQAASTSAAANRPGSWQNAVAERARSEGKRIEVDIAFYGWPVVLGAGMFVGGLAGAVAAGWAVFGLLLSIFSSLYLAARVKYGSGKLEDISQVLMDIRRSARRRSR